jgi:cell wall-associated NlpC family hydrolase
MTEPTLYPSRMSRVLAAAAVTGALVLSGPLAASATGTEGPSNQGSTVSALQIQAQELAGQIQADGRNLDQMAESLDAAQIRSQQLALQLRTLRAGIAETDAQVAATKASLKEEALLAYLSGGAPIITNMPDQLNSDPSLVVSYAEIVMGGQRRAVTAYRTELAIQLRQSKSLTQANRQAAVTLADLLADRTAAAQAFTARQNTLAQVKGRLATLVAQVQAAQQQAEQSAVEANLARQGQLPPATPAVTSDPPPAQPNATPPAQPDVAPPVPTTTGPPATTTSTTTSSSTQTAPSTTTTTTPTTPPSHNTPAPGWNVAVHYAYAQLGKPYQWGGAGPDSFDCSGLTMMAWAAAGVYFPHLAQDQYDMTERIPLSDALPGDLIFYGTPDDVYHVGIYIGGGQMIDAPETGEDVSISSIYWADLLGAGRVEG